jgi:hypothetical protein
MRFKNVSKFPACNLMILLKATSQLHALMFDKCLSFFLIKRSVRVNINVRIRNGNMHDIFLRWFVKQSS